MRVLMTTADHLMIDRRILQEAKTLVDHGHQVTLLAGFECERRQSYVSDGIRIERFVYDWGDSRFATLARRSGLHVGSKSYEIAWTGFRLWARTLARLSSFEQFVHDRMDEHQADVIHAHDYPMLAPAVAAAKAWRVPLVYDAHEIYYAQTQLPRAVQQKYRRREARLIANCDAVITVNPYIARIMSERFGIAEPGVVLNAAPLKPLAVSHLLRQRFGLGEDARIVLYQGWISHNRGIERLVEAAAAFDQGIYLIVIGYGDYKQRLEELVTNNGLSDRVLFFGGVPSDKLHELTCDADLGVIPYYGLDENNYYCSPNKLFEFCAASVPFLANDLPFLRDTAIRFGNGAIADLGSAGTIAAAINSLFSDSTGLKALREATARARRALNWSAEEPHLLEVYEAVKRLAEQSASDYRSS